MEMSKSRDMQQECRKRTETDETTGNGGLQNVVFGDIPQVEAFLLCLVEITTALATLATTRGCARGGQVRRDVLNRGCSRGMLLEVGGDDVELGCIIGNVVRAGGLRCEEALVRVGLVDEVRAFPGRRVSVG